MEEKYIIKSIKYESYVIDYSMIKLFDDEIINQNHSPKRSWEKEA